MDADVKEEPSIEIEGYLLTDATMDQNLSFSEDDQDRESPKKKRKRTKKSAKAAPFKANDEMQQLLRTWGLEVLCERFSKNLIDLSVLDYIVDVDIVDLCRDLPIRYRLILRHKLAEKRGKRAQTSDTNEPQEKSSIWRSMNSYEKSRGGPPLIKSDNHVPKQAKCAIDMVLERPFAKRTEEEKNLLISMDIPRPHLPQLKSFLIRKDKSVTRNFHRSSYESAWWLCGSKKYNKLFCWPCLLFSQPNDPANSFKRGFNDLNHLGASVKSHSTSQRHIDNANAYTNYGQPPAKIEKPSDATTGPATAESGINNNSKRKSTGSLKPSSQLPTGTTDKKPRQILSKSTMTIQRLFESTTVPSSDHNASVEASSNLHVT